MPIANKIAGLAFATVFFISTAALATYELNNPKAQAVSTKSNTSKIVASQIKNVEHMYQIAQSFMKGNPDIRRGMNILGSTYGQGDVMSLLNQKAQNNDIVSKKILHGMMRKLAMRMATGGGQFSFNMQQFTQNLFSSGPFLDLKTSAATVANAGGTGGGASGRAFPTSVQELGRRNVAFAEDEAQKESQPPLNAVNLDMSRYMPLMHCSVKNAAGNNPNFSRLHTEVVNHLVYDPRSPQRWRATGDNLNQSHALVNSWSFARAVGVLEYLKNWKANNPQVVDFSDQNAKSMQAHNAIIIAQAGEMFKMASVNRLLSDIRQEIDGMNEMMSLATRWGEGGGAAGGTTPNPQPQPQPQPQ